MRFGLVTVAAFAVACAGNTDNGTQPITPGTGDGGGGGSGSPDGGPPLVTGPGRAGDRCATGADCQGGYCLGAPGQPEEANPRFAGGYCTALNCTADTQQG